jgi:hypothetical protein
MQNGCNHFPARPLSWGSTVTGLLLSAFLVSLAGCTCPVPVPFEPHTAQIRDRITLYDHPLELRFSIPKTKNSFLVVYATGDGGWHGLDEQIFDWISAWDYAAVGFSSPKYLQDVEHGKNVTSPVHLAKDYKTIIRFAEKKLGIPESSRIILAGLSRGAGLAIIAAGQGELKPDLAGVVAAALIKEEKHVLYPRWRWQSKTNRLERELLKIQTYEYLPRIDSVPVAVIQSTHDAYLPASDARILFGPDTETKKLIPINAKNHRFTGGCLDLYGQIKDALDWICKTAAGQDEGPRVADPSQ